MKKIIPAIVLLIIISNTMFSSEAFDYFLEMKDKEIKPDTITWTSKFDTCVVSDSLNFDKMYNCIKKYILKKDSSDWTESKKYYLYFKRESNTEYNISIDVGYSDAIFASESSKLCRYKDKLFVLIDDIPPYFKDTGKISIINKSIRPRTIYRERFYFVKYKDGVFYNCDYKYNIIEDEN